MSKLTKEEEKRIKELIEQLKDEDKWVRQRAARALGEMGEEAAEAVPVLIEAMKDEKGVVRRRAAMALRKIGEKAEEAVPALIEALKDEDELMRTVAAWALEKMGVKTAIAPLKEAMGEERNKERKFYFAYALARIEGKEGEGTKELRRMKERGDLEEWQISTFESFSQELNIRERVEEVKEEIGLVRREIEVRPESKEKSELTKIIKMQEKILERQEEMIKSLQKMNRRLMEMLREKPRSEIRIKELRQEFDELLVVEDLIKKGEALEKFCALFFSEADGLEVVRRDLRLGDEQIDLVLKNNILTRPYWIQLNSPQILVECKYHNKKISSKDISWFVEKVSRQSLVRVGFFVALKGFSRECKKVLRDGQHKGTTIGLITKEDFEEFFIHPSMTILEFLEYIILKSMM